MPRLTTSPLPGRSLLAKYLGPRTYTDCLAVEVPRPVTLAQYVTAFYTSPAFRPEQWLLRLIGKPSTAADAAALAAGAESFAAWEVEAREPDQLLLRDFAGRTRSWLMVEPLGERGTRLYFGTAVVRASGEVQGRHLGGECSGR